jgi:hypothetical protein
MFPADEATEVHHNKMMGDIGATCPAGQFLQSRIVK